MMFPPALLDLPSPLVEKVKNLYDVRGLVLIISRPRKTKLGDCSMRLDKTATISINSNLSPHQTFMTMIHELAHYYQFMNYGFSGIKLQPHGPEWKSEYKKLMENFFGFNYFDPETEKSIMNHMENPTYSSSGDINLAKALNPDKNIVGELSPGCKFIHESQIYTVIQKLRKNFKCKSDKTGGMFIFPPTIQIKLFL